MLRYKGGGFLHGVPAMDLTDEQAAQFDLAWLIGSGLYELAAEDKPNPPEAEVKKGAKHGRRYQET